MKNLIINVYGILFETGHFPSAFAFHAKHFKKIEEDLAKLFPDVKINICFVPSLFLDRSIVFDFKGSASLITKEILNRKDVQDIFINHMEWEINSNGKKEVKFLINGTCE